MKFWQLVSMFGDHHSARLREVLSTSRWSQYSDWLSDYEAIIRRQDRRILDADLPDDLCSNALALVGLEFYIQNQNVYLYTPDTCPEKPARLLTATEVHDRWGPNAIDEILEFGSIQFAESDRH
jgi:hypothetical protein